MKGFEVAGGSVPGTDHIKPGQPGWMNNQDAFEYQSAEGHIIGVVCDGCGSTPHAEVGAKMFARAIVQILSEQIPFVRGNPAFDLEAAVRQSEHTIVRNLNEVARLMGGTKMIEHTLMNYFLFTIVGVVMTPEQTVIFSFGDGVVSLNGETTYFGSGEGNMPAYIAYRLMNSSMAKERLVLTVRAVVPTTDVQSILIGTDGVSDFIKAEQHLLPGKREALGPLSQFWTLPKFVTNLDAIRRRLALANVETIDESDERPHIRKGLLHDDTTMIVIQRLQEGE